MPELKDFSRVRKSPRIFTDEDGSNGPGKGPGRNFIAQSFVNWSANMKDIVKSTMNSGEGRRFFCGFLRPSLDFVIFL